MKVSVCSSRPILSPCGLKDIKYQVDLTLGVNITAIIAMPWPRLKLIGQRKSSFIMTSLTN